MKYVQVLTANGLAEGDLSHSLTQKYRQIVRLQKAIEKAEAQFSSETDPAKKKVLEQQIAEGKTEFAELDNVLTKKIESWIPTREVTKQRGRALATSKRKAAGTPASTTPAPTPVSNVPEPQPAAPEPAKTNPPVNSPEPEPQPVAATPEPAKTNPPVNTPEPAPAKKDDDKKDKDGGIGWGWLGLAAAAVVGIVLGINHYQNKY